VESTSTRYRQTAFEVHDVAFANFPESYEPLVQTYAASMHLKYSEMSQSVFWYESQTESDNGLGALPHLSFCTIDLHALTLAAPAEPHAAMPIATHIIINFFMFFSRNKEPSVARALSGSRRWFF
jgi:hypothetical protein